MRSRFQTQPKRFHKVSKLNLMHTLRTLWSLERGPGLRVLTPMVQHRHIIHMRYSKLLSLCRKASETRSPTTLAPKSISLKLGKPRVSCLPGSTMTLTAMRSPLIIGGSDVCKTLSASWSWMYAWNTNCGGKTRFVRLTVWQRWVSWKPCTAFMAYQAGFVVLLPSAVEGHHERGSVKRALRCYGSLVRRWMAASSLER
ncbi:hypothetical protein BU23DRAFT_281299 [Bimuria novae-zelandiae CBS 107.79]|uniref:Uncharacterized protein n=1 Tax=Bimuria novae-zelandiae CBS 107.79 TaxID=1447943 RepID=A0A6A5US80_9PLEO|nr:hypothetical protein BU23DRAFT_281299 [Bimuria novae-zelandiae CBS 107.79]